MSKLKRRRYEKGACGIFQQGRNNGKNGGAFGSHTHSGEAAPMVFDTMMHVFKMDMVDLGPLNLTESMMKTNEGMKACRQYAKTLCQKLG
ncbi:MAG: hypothetical protein V1793_16310 [Pseudomonadota bacterium]